MGALRRAAPVPSARPFMKRPRGAALAACGATARAWSTHRGGADHQKLSAPGPEYIKVIRNGIAVEMEVIPVGAGEASPTGRPYMKRPQAVETGSTMARKKPARRAGADEKLSVPSPKRTKVTRNSAETSVEPALGTLRKRMAVELDALHALLRKAEVLCSGKIGQVIAAKPRWGEPVAVAASIKLPPEKRRKVSALAKIAEVESTEDADEFIDICGGVSPIAIQNASPVVSVEKAGETGNSASSSSESGSSSSSDSDSDSDSESDSKTVDIPVPQTVLPKEKATSVQPSSEPVTKVVQRAELEKPKDKKRAAPTAISKTALIAKVKVRRTLLEMERAVLPDESIHPRDLKDLCIPEYGCPSTMRQLGLFLKADA